MDLSILQELANTLRFLSANMVHKANSGHPGAHLGMADILTVLSYHLSHNPKNPTWLNRDRLVFSGGHASALLYSFLHLSGYDLSLDDLFQEYEHDNHLQDYEYLFLLINLALVKKIEFTKDTYQDCCNINKYLIYLRKIATLIHKKNDSYKKN